MNFTRFAFARRAVLAMFAVFAAVLPQAAFAQADALAGTWNYVPNRSNFNPGPARYKNLTLTVTGTGQMTIEGADAQGNPVKITYQNVQDGKPHPVAGMAQYDNSALTRINETMTSYIYSKGKTTVAVGSRVLSRDGNTLTFNEKTYDGKGKELASAIMLFAKPGFEVATVAPAQSAAAATPVLVGPSADETKAGELMEQGKDDEAIALYTKVIDAKASLTLYFDYLSRGIAYAKKGQNDLALADFDAAVKLKPDDADSLFRRGSMRLSLKQYDGAIEDLTGAIKGDEMNAMAYRLRGFAYNTQGKDTLAAPDYDKACALNKELCM